MQLTVTELRKVFDQLPRCNEHSPYFIHVPVFILAPITNTSCAPHPNEQTELVFQKNLSYIGWEWELIF